MLFRCTPLLSYITIPSLYVHVHHSADLISHVSHRLPPEMFMASLKRRIFPCLLPRKCPKASRKATQENAGDIENITILMIVTFIVKWSHRLLLDVSQSFPMGKKKHTGRAMRHIDLVNIQRLHGVHYNVKYFILLRSVVVSVCSCTLNRNLKH